MSREMCYRCFWPKQVCWCGSLRPMATRTRFVYLMHPKEFKQEKAGTGRLTHLCLPNSEIIMGIGFNGHPRVEALLKDPANCCMLVYPGETAFNLSKGDLRREEIGERQLVLFLIDATWACARKMLKLSTDLHALPRVMFIPEAPSRFVIKQQPQDGCLSTLETTHELLLALERSGLDGYADRGQLLELFQRMQTFQIECAKDPVREGYRRRAYTAPTARKVPSSRRNNFLRIPQQGEVPPS